MSKSKNKYGLTDKEEKFCQLYVEIGNGTQAYLDAYDCDPNNRKKACEEASLMCKKQNISDRIDGLREETRQIFLKKKEDILQDLLDILQMTKYSEKEKSIALKAIEQYTKMMGYNMPDQVQIDNTWKVSFGDEDEDEDETNND